MFMRGIMESNETKSGYRVIDVDVEWRVDAVTESDSVAFAASLQKVLNENTAQGYTVSSMLNRPDHALVLVQHRRLIREEILGTPIDGSEGKKAGAN